MLGLVTDAHTESILAAGYSVLLLLVALGIERMAQRSHHRAEAYSTSGFTYHAHIDAWQCPAGQQLLPIKSDDRRRVVRYRARADACNRCPLKAGCTESSDGREIARALDPWLATELGRFHRGLSLVLVALAGSITMLALIRNHADADALLLGATLVVVAFVVRRCLAVLRQGEPGAI